MKINEASKRLSSELGDYISDTFVRFYDKAVLDINRQKKNKYRDITDEDLGKLKKIYALSRIGVPVTVIKDYFNGKPEASELVKKQKGIQERLLKGGLLDEF